jgi:cystathionine gamma-synthase
MKSLPLRVRKQNESAQRIAEFLEGHPAVERVHYPGLTSHPDHRVARRLMSGFGGVVSFEVAGGAPAASRCVDRLQIPFVGPTLGGVESIVQQQALFISLDEAERRASGISDGLIRYAVGIEDAKDLIEDLHQALEGSR